MAAGDLDRQAVAAAITAGAARARAQLLAPDDDRRAVLDNLDRHRSHAARERRRGKAVERRPRAGAAAVEEHRLEGRGAARCLIRAAAQLHRPVAARALGGHTPGERLVQAAENEIGQHQPHHVARRHRPGALGVEHAVFRCGDAEGRERARQ